MIDVYRAVNKYMDFGSGKEYFEYSKVYNKPGPARAHATLKRCPSGKHRPPKIIKTGGNRFEFVETWLERADSWVRV